MIKGYTLTIKDKMIFLRSDATRKTPAVVNAMIDAAGAYRGLCEDWIARIKADGPSYKRIQKEIEPAIIEERRTADGADIYYAIFGKSFSGAYNPDQVIITA